MAIRFFDSFRRAQDGTVGSHYPWRTVNACVTTPARGERSWRSSSSGNLRGSDFAINTAAGATNWNLATPHVSFYLYVDTIPDGAIVFTCTGCFSLRFSSTTSGKLDVLDRWGTFVATSNATLTTGQWYRIDFRGNSDDDSYALRINSESMPSTNIDISGTMATMVPMLRIDANQGASTYYLSDVVLDDAQWVADGNNYRVESIFPTLNGDDTDWAGDVTDIQEEVHDEAATVIQTSTVNAASTFHLEDPSIAAGENILAVKTVLNAFATAGANAPLLIRERITGASRDSGPFTVITASAADTSKVWFSIQETRPGGGTWTEADVDALQVGVVLDGVTAGMAQVTAINANVLIEQAAPPAGVTGAGAVTTGAATLIGSGSSEVTVGSGSLAVAASLLAGSGTSLVPVYTGQAALSVASALLNGSGTVIGPVAGTGNLVAPAASLSGSGTFVPGSIGAGTLATGGATLVGSGMMILPITGSGSLAMAPAVLTGVATASSPGNVAGTGFLTAAASSLSGDGASLPGSNGSGILTAAAATLQGTGSVARDGAGLLVVPSAAFSGTGLTAESVTGVGDLFAPVASCSGAGTVTGPTNFGSGSLAAGAAVLFGTGIYGITNPIGSGVLLAPTTSLAGLGQYVSLNDGSGALSVPKVVLMGFGQYRPDGFTDHTDERVRWIHRFERRYPSGAGRLAPSDPLARFVWQQIAGRTIRFTNTSVAATSYLWDFGDGNSSAERHPTHQYVFSGLSAQFTVTLTINGGASSYAEVITVDAAISGIDLWTLTNEELDNLLEIQLDYLLEE